MMVACPIRLQERCEIFIAHVSANGSKPELDQRVFYAVMEAIQRLGYSTMKPEQFQVVSGIISGRDVFAVSPTGFRQEPVCLPTVFSLVLPVEGTFIVFAVAPLTAIMKDQVKCHEPLHILVATSEA